MPMLPKVIHRFNVILIQIPETFLTEIEKAIVKFIWSHIRPQITKAIFGKNNKAGGNTLSDFKIYSKATIIKTVQY